MLRHRFTIWVTAALLPLSAPAALADSTANAPTRTAISAKDAQRDLRLLKLALTELHPAVFRHITPAAC